jgi:hypothetical protein
MGVLPIEEELDPPLENAKLSAFTEISCAPVGCSCFLRKFFNSFFIKEEELEAAVVFTFVSVCAYGLSLDTDIEGKMLSAFKKDERDELFKIVNIFSYFWVGEFTKSFILGTVRVLLRKPNR